MKTAAIVLTSVLLAGAAPVAAMPAAETSTAGQPADKLMTLTEAKQEYREELANVVLDFLTVMDRVVNQPKQPAMTSADWAPLGDLIDRETFRRVGNYGVRNDWPSYAELLTQWGNMSWWKGYIWRLREVPNPAGGGMVYLETEERSNRQHPVKEDGDYSTLASIAVYDISADGKITRLHVYDQRPL